MGWVRRCLRGIGLACLGAICFAFLPNPVAALDKADRILVLKAERQLILLHDGRPLRTYPIALGPNPTGHKKAQGDGRTPEGQYVIDWRNPNSKYYLSLHISYPNARDNARATAAGVSPGGNIMIHGMPTG